MSLEDSLMARFGIDTLIPPKLRPARQEAPLDHPVIRREVERLQRIVEGQNQEIRATLARYSALAEKQRATLHVWRRAVLMGEAELNTFATRLPGRFAELHDRVGADKLEEAERAVTLHPIDTVWAEHLAFIAEVREGIHLVGIGGIDPLYEFHKQVAAAFSKLHREIEDRTAETLATLEVTNGELFDPALRGPSSTWTYLVNDRALTELQQVLFGHGSSAFSAGAVLMTWPLLLGWALWRRISDRDE